MNIEKIVTLAKKRGFIFKSSEIYGGVAGLYDYGPLGFLLKQKLVDYWRKFFLKDDNIFEIETCFIMPEKVFEASGHLKGFVDPITKCKKCKSVYRADNLIEEKLKIFVEGKKSEELTQIIKENKLKCPECGGELEEVKVFNLMFSTNIGPIEGNPGYLRPETAQGIFVNFKNVLNSLRAKLPFGIAQVNKSFRNEISPRQWLIRLREFTQAEIEFFVNPEERFEKWKIYENIKIRVLTREAQRKNKEVEEMTIKEALERGVIPIDYMAYFIAKEQIFYESLGIPKEAIRFRHILEEETPHYSKGNLDMEIKFDFGWKEVVGNAYRTDYDLKNHSIYSKEDLSYVYPDGKKIIPHVVEPSFGIERTIYAIMLYSFVEDKERGWDWFKFVPKISPINLGIFPLLKRDNLPEKAREIYENLKKDFDCIYEESDSIGKRYARADEIGVNFCITVDHQTLEDSTVTIRDRDTTKQTRVKISELKERLRAMLA
ncbi:MAG: glycine--tRNA ligase [Candidatus Aenigmarchaeota archaeon]|nr:glycine--tRNA ligase [Candidatus Aenigmarchaeota archaeon]MCX8190738.1 glycine--tRNA ligase [Candidatus Aenigmarchaeota archaeon]MDW8159986.1 glycine--tRNA ligase [Candidatus Aenigmarchaeota archaeon]